MDLMSPLDSMFLIGEGREHPMHVGGLMLFVPPDGSGAGYARTVYEYLLRQTNVAPRFRKRPAWPAGQIAWSSTEDIDFEHHVRLLALPAPGRIRELLAMVSRLHASLLDRHRPLWEAHVIEGLSDGRVAMYVKVHHALVDGVSALRLLQGMLSPDPAVSDCRAAWTPAPHRARASSPDPGPLRAGAAVVRDVAGMVPALGRIAGKLRRGDELALPLTAPRTMLNVPVGGARRFAAQSWDIERIRKVASAADAKLNDVVLAMCGGALRKYLLAENQLPTTSLIAAVPVSLHALAREAGGQAAGNAVTLIICSLGTDKADPLERFRAITTSVGHSKELLRKSGRIQALTGGALLGSALLLEPVPGYHRISRPPFNLIISNVPGPQEELYFNGARLDGCYPLSIPIDGLALNITLTSRAGFLDFGLTGCRQSVPHLQRLLAGLDESLSELELALT